VDIYSIGLKVDSSQVKTAQKELGGMGRQAKGTGNSVQKFGKSSKEYLSLSASLALTVLTFQTHLIPYPTEPKTPKTGCSRLLTISS